MKDSFKNKSKTGDKISCIYITIISLFSLYSIFSLGFLIFNIYNCQTTNTIIQPIFSMSEWIAIMSILISILGSVSFMFKPIILSFKTMAGYNDKKENVELSILFIKFVQFFLLSFFLIYSIATAISGAISLSMTFILFTFLAIFNVCLADCAVQQIISNRIFILAFAFGSFLDLVLIGQNFSVGKFYNMIFLKIILFLMIYFLKNMNFYTKDSKKTKSILRIILIMAILNAFLFTYFINFSPSLFQLGEENQGIVAKSIGLLKFLIFPLITKAFGLFI
ncbi:hypothetical protein TCON_1496 [Astathelohania contejeani]|uniref:Uncharacterized protein n=1 Tax=Astathelohania contejeani TaxID=164912 RepID=A0ABQ7HYM7_9MICR|nr:hypothetical protein TCON_1496 [Thelohania contejeani]